MSFHYDEFITRLAIVPEIPSAPELDPPKFSVVCGLDIVFLVEDLPSMHGRRCELVSRILDHPTAVATSYDPDGINVQYLKQHLGESGQSQESSRCIQDTSEYVLGRKYPGLRPIVPTPR